MTSMASPVAAAAYADAGTPVGDADAKRKAFTPATFAVIRAGDRAQQRRLLRQSRPPAAIEPPEPERANDWAAPLFACGESPAHFCVALLVPWATAAYVAHHIQQPALLAGLALCAAYTATLVCLPMAQRDDGSWHLFAGSSNARMVDLDDYQRTDAPALTQWDVVVLGGVAVYAAGVALLRFKAREFYDIRGWSFGDCCASAWCSWCVLAQMAAHTRVERAQYRDDDGEDGGEDATAAADTATLPAYSAA